MDHGFHSAHFESEIFEVTKGMAASFFSDADLAPPGGFPTDSNAEVYRLYTFSFQHFTSMKMNNEQIAASFGWFAFCRG